MTRKFPSDPVLVRLLQSAKVTTETIIHDAYGFDKTYPELLGDIVQTRDALLDQLPSSAVDKAGLLHEDRPYICVLTRGGYEFIVAFFAIRAIGGACMPLASGTLVEEAEYFLSITKATCLLVGGSHAEQAGKIAAFANQQGISEFATLRVSADAPPLGDIDIGIDEGIQVALDGPGVVMFTSGTTGKPKAAVLPKQCLVSGRMPPPGGSTLNYRPPHWRGGLAALITPPMTGLKLYTLKQGSSAEDVWEALKNYRITNLIFNPILLRRLKEAYLEKIEHLAAEEALRYLDGFKNLGKIKCNGATISPTLLKFWLDLTGMPFQNGYGSTECGGGVMETSLHKPMKNRHAVGSLVVDPPVDVKLSMGDHGEILVKSPWMLTKYIGNEAATSNAFDDEGYLKTGDLARLVDGEYVFEGRARTDFIGRVSKIAVEDALAGLAYIEEAYVVAVPDHEIREHCGALIRIKKGTIARDELSLSRLHTDLSNTLPAYMRPYLLRVLDDGEEVPLTASLKPIAREIVKKFFGVEECWNAEKPTPGVEVWNSPLALNYQHHKGEVSLDEKLKPWDWAAAQMAG
ncbi:Acyl-CoA synthetase family member 3, mitochondrial [Purpureocillium lavendulum]|uniref:Acyl-CoA synthetase family member 3, mitochondrial n=1 Tax=Purpureocillium lavendulum TaxID=1247861 RepID=A0AB34FVU0_9HYPO|nr:Acyl-CoA synthetase family member 3, mitochondrial [Purpureocillium lavendulum]